MNTIKKYRVVLVLILIGLIFFGWLAWFYQVDTDIISKTAHLRRVIVGNEKTQQAYLSLDYNSDGQKYLYVNVLVDLNTDGEFVSYQNDGKTQAEWVIQNMNSRVLVNEGINLDFPLVDLTADTRQDFPVIIVLTDDKLESWHGEKIRNSAFQSLIVKSIEADDVSTLYSPHPDRDGGVSDDATDSVVVDSNEEIPNRPPVNDKSSNDQDGTEAVINIDATGSQPTKTKNKEKTIATLGKEFNVFHGDVPDILQGNNECAIMSTANSLLWLAKENKFTDKMPQTQADLVTELKTDLKWNNDGVDTKTDYLSGKKAFTDRHKIPLETHMVNVMEYDVNIVAKIAQELNKGQDVEVSLAYWQKKADGTWEKTGGHMVTAVGATGYADGTQTLDIHDPLSPGPSKLDIYKVNGTRVDDYKYGGNQVTYIRAAIAESPITPPPVVLEDKATPAENSNITITTPTPVKDFILSGNFHQTSSDDLITIDVTITPKNLGDKVFNGINIEHDAQNLVAPYDSVLNVNMGGDNASDWGCMCGGSTYSCSGTDTLQDNQDTFWSMSFPTDINVPDNLNIDLLTNGEVTASVNLIEQ